MGRTASKLTGISLAGLALVLALAGGEPGAVAQAPAPAANVPFAQINETDVRGWLTYLSSDLMQGRQVFTEGYGLAASYIAGELKAMGARPLGDNGTYLQAVFRRGYRVGRHSSVTITVAGESRTFRDGDHVAFPLESGGAQTLTFPEITFLGDDRAADTPPAAANATRRLVLFAERALPQTLAARRRVTFDDEEDGAAAAVMAAARASGAIAFSPGAPIDRVNTDAPVNDAAPDVVTTGRIDRLHAPALAGDQALFEWLFSKAGVSWPDVWAKIDAGQPVPSVTLRDVRITVAVDNAYTLVSTDRTENVVAMVEGTDPALRQTYVFFGAHLDHVGYARGRDGSNGRVNVPLAQDAVWNGADDDGSGSTAILAIAKAFVTGPKPKRSVVFVWHAGEEAGLLGSRYMSDFPVVPLERIQVELNIDMIGRNRDDNPAQANTVYVIGDDRISTDLHNLLVETNAQLRRPLTLDYEFNDPNDPNSFYTRSDHYSYASRGIPIAFFFTGEHPDYHANTDSVDKILFPKLVRIAQFIYEAGFAIADTNRVLTHDNQGPRAGRGFQGELPEGKSRS